MRLTKIRNTIFHRIGNSYGHYFDPDHFMGQGALDAYGSSNDPKKTKEPQIGDK